MTKVAIKTWQVAMAAMAGCFGILGDCRMKNGQASILHGAINTPEMGGIRSFTKKCKQAPCHFQQLYMDDFDSQRIYFAV